MSKIPLIDLSSKYLTKSLKAQNLENDISHDSVPYIHYGHISHGSDESKDRQSSKIDQKLAESYTSDLPKLEWHKHNDNAHLGKTSTAISSTLSKKAPKLSASNPARDDIREYTGSSRDLNAHLLQKKRKDKYFHSLAKQLHKTTSALLGHDVHLYSGVRSDPEKWDKNSKGHVRLKAFTSMTHDKKVAHSFARTWAENHGKRGSKNLHIIHIHAKSTDHGMHVRKYSAHANEHETILPADTYIKKHPKHKTPEIHESPDGTKVHIHHYVIHKQVHPDHYEPHSK